MGAGVSVVALETRVESREGGPPVSLGVVPMLVTDNMAVIAAPQHGVSVIRSGSSERGSLLALPHSRQDGTDANEEEEPPLPATRRFPRLPNLFQVRNRPSSGRRVSSDARRGTSQQYNPPRSLLAASGTGLLNAAIDRELEALSQMSFGTSRSQSPNYSSSSMSSSRTRESSWRTETHSSAGAGAGGPARGGSGNSNTHSPRSMAAVQEFNNRILLLADALFQVLQEMENLPNANSSNNGMTPATSEAVNSLPTRKFTAAEKAPTTSLMPGSVVSEDDEGPQCYICLAEYEVGDSLRVLPCKHEFHCACVDKWLKDIHEVCPLCRSNVSTSAKQNMASSEAANTASLPPVASRSPAVLVPVSSVPPVSAVTGSSSLADPADLEREVC